MTENSFTELALSWTGTPVQQSGKVHRCYLLPREGGQSAPNLAAAPNDVTEAAPPARGSAAELLLQQGRAVTAGALSASPCLAATIGTAECEAVGAKNRHTAQEGASCYSRGGL